MRPKLKHFYFFFIDQIDGRFDLLHKNFNEQKKLILFFSREFQAHHFSFLIFYTDIDGASFWVQKPSDGLEEDPLLFGLFEWQVVVFKLDEHAFQGDSFSLLEVGPAA